MGGAGFPSQKGMTQLMVPELGSHKLHVKHFGKA